MESNSPSLHQTQGDSHLIYAVVLIGLAAVHAGDTLGFGRSWARTDLVRQHPTLR